MIIENKLVAVSVLSFKEIKVTELGLGHFAELDTKVDSVHPFDVRVLTRRPLSKNSRDLGQLLFVYDDRKRKLFLFNKQWVELFNSILSEKQLLQLEACKNENYHSLRASIRVNTVNAKSA